MEQQDFQIDELHSLLMAGNTQEILDRIYRIFNLRIPRLPKELGLSFLNVENDAERGSRIGLSYILKKIS
ncbi:MAG: hypothetical protein GWN62_11705 [Aliifodinibius sp.]|nr:hypothetical protein [Nitrosopumilaceae archaeon]NIV11905.1 hypothetical protein [Fodinibius sp.]NIV65487.1 hypothetical protein [Nitrosopumilaceae archaeon]NIX61023.1 hypothetical protein [Nitrosopumilaceae archaeon]